LKKREDRKGKTVDRSGALRNSDAQELRHSGAQKVSTERLRNQPSPRLRLTGRKRKKKPGVRRQKAEVKQWGCRSLWVH